MRAPAIAAVALVAVLAGCSSGDYDDQVPDDATLTVYVSAPLRGESGGEGRAIVNGAKLALEDAGGEAGGVDVEPVYMDDTGGQGGWDPVVVADNARRAAQDSTAIAYIGDLESGATRISLPITNQAQMLQVSAASTGVDLTRESSASDDVPQTVQPTGERTFGRVIPDDKKQAGAGAVWAKKLGLRERHHRARQQRVQRRRRRTSSKRRRRRSGSRSRREGSSAYLAIDPTDPQARPSRRRLHGDGRASSAPGLMASTSPPPPRPPSSCPRPPARTSSAPTRRLSATRPTATPPTATRRWRSCSTRSSAPATRGTAAR